MHLRGVSGHRARNCKLKLPSDRPAFAIRESRSACCSRKASMSSWFSAAAEAPTEASPAAALDEAMLLKSLKKKRN